MILNHPEKKDLISSVIINFVLYNPHFDYFFYYTILFEIRDNLIVDFYLTINPFHPNNYYNLISNTYFRNMYVADVIRILINIYFTLFFLKEYFTELKEYSKNNEQNSPFKVLLQPKFIIELSIIILYFSRFSFKTYFSIIFPNLKAFAEFKENKYEGNKFIKQIYIEFFQAKDFYVKDKLYDIILFFISYIRFIGYFIYNPKMKDFLSFIFNLLSLIGKFIFFYMIIIVFLCVFCNNLFGSDQIEYSEFTNSLIYVFLFCNGHNNLIINKVEYEIWEIVFIFMIFLTIVYFLNSIFFGIYLEYFRIFSWKTGYSDNKKYKSIFKKLFNIMNINQKQNNEVKKEEIKNIEMQEKNINISNL